MWEPTNQSKADKNFLTFFFYFAMHIRERLMLLMGCATEASKPEGAKTSCPIQTLGFDSTLRIMSYLDNQSLYQVSCTNN